MRLLRLPTFLAVAIAAACSGKAPPSSDARAKTSAGAAAPTDTLFGERFARPLDAFGIPLDSVRFPMDTMLRFGLGSPAPTPPELKHCRGEGLGPDSLVYGDISQAGEDASGIEFLFVLIKDTMRAHVRLAAGGVSLPLALQDLRYRRDSDSVTAWYTSGGRDVDSLSVRLTCNVLSGIERYASSAWRNEKALVGTRKLSVPRIQRPFAW